MPYADVILADGPVAYYRLNEASGNPQDSSTSANHATSTGGTPGYRQPGLLREPDTSMRFDGLTEWVGVPDHLTLDLGDTFTLEAWIRTDRAIRAGENWGIVSKGSGAYYMRVYETGQLELLRSGVADIVWSDVAVDDGQVHHVVATKSGATVKLYVDGVDETGAVTDSTCVNNTAGLTVGGGSTSVELFLGLLDEVAVYPTALSAARVQMHYAAGIGIPVLVGAGSGAERLTAGSFTVSKTGCKAGNLVAFHMQVNGTTADWGGFTNVTNVENLGGQSGALNFQINALDRQLAWGRVRADGTVSADLTVGASGEDIAARVYEFSGEHWATSLTAVLENGVLALANQEASGTSTSILDADVTTNGPNRLALNFVGVKAVRTLGDFTGETGGDWLEAVAEYAGTTVTLQLQTALLESATVIDGGSQAITSAAWQTIGTAIIPDTAALGRQLRALSWLS